MNIKIVTLKMKWTLPKSEFVTKGLTLPELFATRLISQTVHHTQNAAATVV